MTNIIDQNGRIGIIDQDHGEMVFAHPVGVQYVIDDNTGMMGVPRAQLITTTAWYRNDDGSYRGKWYDAPLYDQQMTARDA